MRSSYVSLSVKYPAQWCTLNRIAFFQRHIDGSLKRRRTTPPYSVLLETYASYAYMYLSNPNKSLPVWLGCVAIQIIETLVDLFLFSVYILLKSFA